MMLYAVMVLFTIFANGWIGSAMTTWARENGLDGEFVRHGNQGDRNADSDVLDLSV